MKKEVKIYFAICLLFLSLSFADAAVHSSSDVYMSIDGTSRTLQYAVSNNYFRTASHTYGTTVIVAGHEPSQIWVSVDGTEQTLSTALSKAYGLCGSKPITSYSRTIPNPSHLATEIILGSGKTLQQAINDGDFCCIPTTCGGNTCGTYDNGCSGTINCGSCTSPYTCKKGPFGTGDYKCRCTVTTSCGSKECGSITNNCGTTTSCGSCSSGYDCQNYQCVYVAGGGSSSSDTAVSEGDTSHTNPFTGATGDYDGDGQTDGGSGGSSGGGKLICTELYRQGLMDEEIYLADQEFGKYMKETHPEIMAGYTSFAIPIVEKMKESEEFTQAVNVVVKPWSEEMAYKAGLKESGNFVGAVIMNVGMVIFWITGSLALGQISLLFLTQMTLIVILLVGSMIYLNKLKNKRR